MDSARKYVVEWLTLRANEVNPKTGELLSAWTIQTEAKALGKLYGIDPNDKDYFVPPTRHRYDVTRSRGDAVRDAHFSEKNNDELVKFCKGTGLRRREITDLRGDSLYSKEELRDSLMSTESSSTARLTERIPEGVREKVLKDAMLFEEEKYLLVKGKGGRVRLSPIIGSNADKIVERVENTPNDRKVWEYVSKNADIHSYRSDYATSMYKKYARSSDELNILRNVLPNSQSEIYFCRNEEKGKILDKKAMSLVSKALGHNRVSIVASSYLRGI